MQYVRFMYTNHRGEVGWRTVQPVSLDWLPNPGYGYAPGWFLRGFDHDRAAIRSFRLSHIVRGHDSELFRIEFGEGEPTRAPNYI